MIIFIIPLIRKQGKCIYTCEFSGKIACWCQHQTHVAAFALL